MKSTLFKAFVVGKAALTLGLLIYNSSSFAAQNQGQSHSENRVEIKASFGSAIQCTSDSELSYCSEESGCKISDLCKGAK